MHLKIIRNARIKYVGMYQSRMANTLLFIFKRTRTAVCARAFTRVHVTCSMPTVREKTMVPMIMATMAPSISTEVVAEISP
eukprot:COSAG05_NODE_436_length_9838_cov_49.389876_10_plen_81_part_00